MLFSLQILAAITSSRTMQPTLGRALGNQPEWIRNDDFGKISGGGAARFKVVFTPDGLPNKCVIEATTGNDSVDKLICTLVADRFRFKPSMNVKGEPAYRVFVRAANFDPNTTSIPPAIAPAPFVVIPSDGGRRDGRSAVVAEVDEQGALAACSGPPDIKQQDQNMMAAACQAIAMVWKPMPETDASGSPVRYVRDFPFEYRRTNASSSNGH